MNTDPAQGAEVVPPAVMFSHFGINVDDADKLEDFYTRVLGFCVSDDGLINKDTDRIIFMTRRPREHHQFVLAGGRSSENPSTVSETGFKAPSLDALTAAHLRWAFGPGSPAPESDLRDLARDRNIPDAVRTQARRLYHAKR